MDAIFRMGTQWTGMAKGLMDVKIFRESIERSAKILEPYGIDLMELILGDSDDNLVSLLASSVGIAAVQIALVDIVRALGIKPDGFIGHSSGELGCGYVNQALDAREMILYAYWRGKCVEMGNITKGLMAAVGLTWDEASKRCPPGVVPACHNAPDSVTISGAYEDVDTFLAQLKSENIFTKRVNSCDTPFHSIYMEAVAPDMIEKLDSVTPGVQRLRSKHWISTSVPESQWLTPEGQLSNPYYYVNNLTSPVLFQEALQFIPRDAIVIEISPDSLFKNVIRRSLGPDCRYVGLMRRNNSPEDNVSHLLTAIGELFCLGLKPRVEHLYPKVTYPVKRGTQSLGSLVRWDHSDHWLVTLYPDYFNYKSQSEITVDIDFNNGANRFYLDHCIDGRHLFPATGYLYLVWEELARQLATPRDQLPVIFESVRFLRSTLVSEDQVLSFKLNLSQISGEFHLFESDVLTVTGRIRTPGTTDNFLPLQQKLVKYDMTDINDSVFPMDSRDIYKELWIRGYHYGAHFQPLSSADIDKNRSKLRFTDNWITFSDALLHFSILNIPTRDLLLPTSIERLHCDPRLLTVPFEWHNYEIQSNLSVNYTITHGLEIYGLGCSRAARRKAPQELTLERYVWLPYMDNSALDESKRQLVDIYLQVIEDLMESMSKTQMSEHLSQLNALLAINDINSDDLVLKNILENFNTNANIGQELSSDMINNVYFEESLLRPAIDTVLENNTNTEFNVLEINLNQEICYEKLIHYLKDSFYKLNVNYSVYNPLDISSHTDNSYQTIDINFLNATQNPNTKPLSLAIIRDPYPSKEKQLVSYEDIFRYVNLNLESNGFVIILKRNEWTKAEKVLFTRFGYSYEDIEENQLIALADKLGLSLVSHRSDSDSSSVILLRKVSTNEIKDDVVIRVSHQDMDQWFEKLKNLFQSDSNEKNLIWLVSDAVESSGIVGFVNSLRREPGGHRIRCISDLMFSDDIYLKSLSFKEQISSLFQNNLVMNVYKNGRLGSYRYLSLSPERMTRTRVRHAMLAQKKANDKSVFDWFETKHTFFSEKNILLNVFYAGLNGSDIHRESADTSNYSLFYAEIRDDIRCLSSEFSGVDDFGKRYCGVKPNACLSTTLAFIDSNELIPIPDHWSLEEACTVPVAYGTGYLALVIKAQLQSKHHILIHTGDGYLGRAAIAIAQSYGCHIYASVSTIESKETLLAYFPSLNKTDVINTSIECFKEVIHNRTDGKGVDIVLDCMNEYDFESSLFCVKQNGRFISTENCLFGKVLSNDRNISIDRINFDNIFNERNDDSMTTSLRHQVLSHIKEGIRDNVVKPLASRMFTTDRVSEALDYMSSNTNKRKVLVRIRDEDNNNLEMNLGSELMVDAVHNTQFSSDRSYIITGGLGGFGLELAHWMTMKGAKNLIITSRTGIKNYFQEYNVNRIRGLRGQVVITQLDASDEKQCEELICMANSMAPIGGIFSLAMVLSDGIFANQTQESMHKVFAPKVQALKHLDIISRELCPKLRHFVAFSSVVSGRGNPGQTNYGYANSFMERLCELRRADGLPALAIQWGAIADVGVVTDMFATAEGQAEERVIGGTVPQRIHSCLSLLNHMLRSTDSVITSVLRPESKIEGKAQKRDILSVITDALGIRDASKIRLSARLPELGMDSLTVVEIKHSLETEFHISLSLQQLSNITFADVIQMTKSM